MSLPLLEQLVRLMAENELANIELQDGEQRIVLHRGGGMQADLPQGVAPPMAPMAPGAQPMPSSPSATAAPATPGGAEPKPADSTAVSGNLVEVKSPMVGTYYASPSPDARPFVQLGDRVSPDTDVCIIEAMKVFNNIKAETSGTIEKILVENGEPVEYGQALFLVNPS